LDEIKLLRDRRGLGTAEALLSRHSRVGVAILAPRFWVNLISLPSVGLRNGGFRNSQCGGRARRTVKAAKPWRPGSFSVRSPNTQWSRCLRRRRSAWFSSTSTRTASSRELGAKSGSGGSRSNRRTVGPHPVGGHANAMCDTAFRCG